MNSLFLPPLTTDTADAARALFSIESEYIAMGDQVEGLFSDLNLAELDASGDKQPDMLFVLAMVTIFQYLEDLPDRQVAEVIHKRTDWMYAMRLSLDSPDFELNNLCEFRQRLLHSTTGQQLFQEMLSRLIEGGFLESRIEHWQDARNVLDAVCTISRVDQLVHSITLILEVLAASKPELLRVVTLPHWYDRYYPLSPAIKLPYSREEQQALVQAIGKDARYLIEVVVGNDMPSLAQLPEFKNLGRIWSQQFERAGNNVSWRENCSICRGLAPISRDRV
jgi:transposase